MWRSVYRNRRRLATGSAMVLAAVLGYFAVAGDNGLRVYKQKRMEDAELSQQIDQLKQENAKLQAHVERLQGDPDAIEHEAREKLHYARPGEVIFTLKDGPNSAKTNASGQAPAPSPPKHKRGSAE
ncbi:Cell division protein DivIC (FtsB), stabilizes FtsL against RasP cleavage [Acidisarcina polymorpha]|uniref:Cell division protein DivIC (FtsB), stabilizes FtsL against RasP cleavage n=1 Tax=Acidisarcina polymorpha TaxID=2211140 RepID=A0A2Z5FS77_9BACT|nr:Cell division protein DivIC (FtsB), stabilizes FtsL against RasP cleavage [Acidisarcina polymorpha]